MLTRRQLMAGLGASMAGLRAAEAEPAGATRQCVLTETMLEVPGEKLASRCLLLAPSHDQAPRGLLVLLHGLGETSSEAVGIRAWADRYGLLEAVKRLERCAPLRSEGKHLLLTDERLAELEDRLSRRPYAGFAIACPFTPNVFRQPSTAQALDRYTSWLTDGLLPEIRKKLTLPAGPTGLCIDGVSLGGYVSLEVFLRRPELFGAVGALQPAVGVNLADAYAARFRGALDRVGSRALRIASSSWDNEREASERLVARLRARNVPTTFDVSPGGHDQRFLCEVGTLELLLHYDRVLSPAPPYNLPSP